MRRTSLFMLDEIRSQQQHRHPRQAQRQTPLAPSIRISSRLLADPSSSSSSSTSSSNEGKKVTTTTTTKTQGVYVRPSGAIERGSGFFVPGLEGPRVRLVVGIVLLVLTGINHVLIPTSSFESSSSSSISLEEGLAVSYSVLILFQAAIEYFKEIRLLAQQEQGSNTNTSTQRDDSFSQSLPQRWSTSIRTGDNTVENDDDKDRVITFQDDVQWAAASFLAMTPATTILLLTKGDTLTGTTDRDTTATTKYQPQILYQLGGTLGSDNDDGSVTNIADPQQQQQPEATTKTQQGILAALDQVNQSKGGRISLPMTHPAVVQLLPYLTSSSSSSSSPRTVIVQRITDDSCWLVSSDQLLASFTSNDLKWLGQLARYVSTTTV